MYGVQCSLYIPFEELCYYSGSDSVLCETRSQKVMSMESNKGIGKDYFVLHDINGFVCTRCQ